MAKFTGRQQEVLISKEASARGTIAVGGLWSPKTNYTVEDKVQKAEFQGNYGVLAGGDDAIPQLKWAEGDLELEAIDKVIGYLLMGVFGTLTTGSYLSAYKHTLTLQNSVQPTTLSLLMNDPIGAAESANGTTIAYAMAMINSLELTAEIGALVKARANFIAKAHQDWTRQTSSYTAENKFSHRDVKFYVAANAAGLDASSKINVQSLSVKIEKSVLRENALGTVQPVDILARLAKISGKIKLTYADRTYRDYMLNGTKKAVRIAINNQAVTIGTTTPQIQIDLPVVHFDGWQPTNPSDDISMQEINFTALFDPSTGLLIGSNTFLVNNKALYTA